MDEVEAVQLKVADAIGTLMEFWGFKRPMGRIWTLLFLSPEPLSAAELGERLAMSAGAVSMTIAELSKWGVVRRTWKPGERRDYFEAETNIWKMVTRVFRERELELIRDVSETFREAHGALSQVGKGSRVQAERVEFVRRRVAMLSALAAIGEQLVSAVVGAGRVDTSALRRFSVMAGKGPRD